MDSPAAVYTIDPGRPFVDTLAAGILARHGADPLTLADVLVLVPTRRAVGALQAAFLRQSEGAALILPRIRPLGDLDDDDMALEGGADDPRLDLPPAIPPLHRLLLLTRLIQGVSEPPDGRPRSAAEAARLATELARLLDQVQTEGLSFAALATLVEADLAAHWQRTVAFLGLISEHWPRVLAERGQIDPADRRNRALLAEAERLRRDPPRTPVIAAGSTGSVPATAALLGVIARLPQGSVVLPGLDRCLDDASWSALEATHPQWGMQRLLGALAVERRDVRDWTVPDPSPGGAARRYLVRELMRPAATAGAWRDVDPARLRAGLEGIDLMAFPGRREEAQAIAIAMREAVAESGPRAALVTPDRALARQVAAELLRWDIRVDDSAGRPLGDTLSGTLLRLTARLARVAAAPLPLLAALGHPAAAAGLEPVALRQAARRLERVALRGVRPPPGFAPLIAALAEAGEDTGWLRALAVALEPLADALSGPRMAFDALLRHHVAFVEWLAATPESDGAARLWAGPDGEALARFMADLTEGAAALGPVAGRDYPGLLDELLRTTVVRPRGVHPQLHVWGPLEARLQQADLLIVGGCNEGTWPRDAGADPWMNRAMRLAFGLPPPERFVGLAAHDMAQAMTAPRVLLTRAEKTGGQPTVASRWWQRLETLLAGAAIDALPRRRALRQWVEALDAPAGVQPVSPPAPRPPLAARPDRLSVTEVEKLLHDPYAIYARRVLGLTPLDPLDADPGAAERGVWIHDVLDRFIAEHTDAWPPDALERLLERGRKALETGHLSAPGLRAFWGRRFERIAAWFVATEGARRAHARPLATEVRGRLLLPIEGGAPFTLSAKADRIDRLADGQLAIIDYKTGRVPSQTDVRSGRAPQLPLEAAMATAGAFGPDLPRAVGELAYWHLTGAAATPGRIVDLSADLAAQADAARYGLERLIAAYRDPDRGYPSRPLPGHRAAGDYDHLARVKEWEGGS